MATIIKAKGGNKSKNARANDEFQAAKKIGRPKQIWVYDELEGGAAATSDTPGHWEKTT